MGTVHVRLIFENCAIGEKCRERFRKGTEHVKGTGYNTRQPSAPSARREETMIASNRLAKARGREGKRRERKGKKREDNKEEAT